MMTTMIFNFGMIFASAKWAIKGDAKHGQVQSLKNCTYNIYLFAWISCVTR